ncbi:death-associated protein kinase 1-like isoform X2 [Oscarella lobularis]|uniref:death-associated protein kinase 1-like isoform X2 n=2 Tax=Oscarella lobularis TaxID=121494 RepID=UPI00331416B0
MPLWAAHSNDQVEIVQLLINAGADFNEIDFDRSLHRACLKGNAEMVKVVINAGANVNKTSDGKGLLWEACSRSHVEIVELLINAGAKVNKTDGTGRRLLWEACCKGDVKIVKLLIDAGADINESDNGRRLLWEACCKGHVEIFKLLIDAGADVTKTDSQKNSLLHLIAKDSNEEIVVSGCTQVELLKVIISQDHSLIDRANKDDVLPHEITCATEVMQFLFDSWTSYRYYELYSRGTTKPEKLKVCVIGEARAGKTTLIKTLRNINWRKGGDDERTASMEVSVAKVKSAGELVFCDFAGQSFFHKTHGLFFSESTTAFLLVADLTKSDNDLLRSSHYFCSFVKCSVIFTEKAYFLVIGSKSDMLSVRLETLQIRLRHLVTYLRLTFGRWFIFCEDFFVLNCRDRSSKTLSHLRKNIGLVKALAIKTAKEVPIIVKETSESFLPTLRNPFQRQSFLAIARSLLSSKSKAEKAEVRAKTLLALKRNRLITETEQACAVRHMKASVFKQLLVECVYPGLTDQVQNLLVEFLQGIGEVLAIKDSIILDPSWLCRNVIGPLLSPVDFPVSLSCFPPGTATKEKIKSALEIFNGRKWDNIDETISLLSHLEICYLVPGKSDTYQFPALLEEQRSSEVWQENPEMTVYVGRRIKRLEETDIITPGTMPFLQCHVRNAACFRGLEPIVWQGGLMIKATIDGVSVEGMIGLTQEDKSLDFVVRGPQHSERECMKLLTDLKNTGEKILREKSPGMDRCLWYISCTELKQLKESPLAYKETTINEKIKNSSKSSASVSEGTVKDSLKDLLAFPDNHINFLSYRNLRVIQKCLEKDVEGTKALSKYLQGLSLVDKAESESAETLIFLWSENLSATAECLAAAARKANLLYLLALLHSDGAIELLAEEKELAEKDLEFIQENPPSNIRESRFVEQTDTKPTTSFSQKSAALKEQGTEHACLFDDEYLDTPVTSRERFEASRRIQSIWKQIGRVLEPEPYKHYDLHTFGDKRSDMEAALEMLDAWADNFGARATRRRLIDAMKYLGYSAEVAEIFQGGGGGALKSSKSHS